MSVVSTPEDDELSWTGPAKLYPRKLPPCDNAAIIDELGFTATEKCAIKAAWRTLKPFQRRIGKEVFQTFLVEHETAIEHFRTNDYLAVATLHAHSSALMYYIGNLIEIGLGDPSTYHIMLTECANMHRRFKINPRDFARLTEYMMSCLLEKTKKHESSNLVNAFQKIVAKLNFYVLTGNKDGKQSGIETQIYGRLGTKLKSGFDAKLLEM